MLCTYRYLSILFIFKLAFSQKWHVPRNALPGAALIPPADPDDALSQPATPDPNELIEVKRSDLEPLFMPEDPPQLPLWERFGLVVPVIGVVLLIGLGGFLARGTTSVGSLDPGACFIDTTEVEIDRLETPGCDQPHDSEIVAEIELVNAPDDMPADSNSFWDDVFEQCVDKSFEAIQNPDQVPEDTLLLFFSPTEEGWDRGDRTIICYIHNPEGLVGSYVTADA